MQQALDALKYNQSNWSGKSEAIAALEAELAKPEQASNEPPDYVEPPTSDYHNGWEEGFEVAKNLYPKKTKREWVGLTGTEINHIFAANVGYPERMCCAIEAKLKEKNGG